MTIDHAYGHWIGRIVGVERDGEIVSARVMTPEMGQDHNWLLVKFVDHSWADVRAMDTRREDFITVRVKASKVGARYGKWINAVPLRLVDMTQFPDHSPIV